MPSRHIRHKTVVSMGIKIYCITRVNKELLHVHTLYYSGSYTEFLEQCASNNFPDIVQNFMCMHQQWFPGSFSYGLGTRLTRAKLVEYHAFFRMESLQ